MALTVRERLIKRFVKFHAENPHVYSMFSRFAFEAINAGASRLSARLIIERMRWETMIETKGSGWNAAAGKHYKIANAHAPYLARLFALDYPQHAALFQFVKEQA